MLIRTIIQRNDEVGRDDWRCLKMGLAKRIEPARPAAAGSPRQPSRLDNLYTIHNSQISLSLSVAMKRREVEEGRGKREEGRAMMNGDKQTITEVWRDRG